MPSLIRKLGAGLAVGLMLTACNSAPPEEPAKPTFGDWGFTLARRGPLRPAPMVPKDAPPLRFLTQRVLDAATVFAPDTAPQHLPPSTLEHPLIVDDMRRGYR